MWMSLTMQDLHMMQCGLMHWPSTILWKKTSRSCQTYIPMCPPSEYFWTVLTWSGVLLQSTHRHVLILHWYCRRFVELLEATDFHGVSGHITFQGASRVADINVVQWLNNRTKVVGVFHPNISAVRQELSGSMYVHLLSTRVLTPRHVKYVTGIGELKSSHFGLCSYILIHETSTEKLKD